MRRLVSRLLAALALVATVATASAATASADPRRPDLGRQHVAPTTMDGQYRTADWWF